MKEYISYNIFGDFNKSMDIVSRFNKLEHIDTSSSAEYLFNCLGAKIKVYKGSEKELKLIEEVEKNSSIWMMLTGTYYELENNESYTDFEFLDMRVSWEGMNTTYNKSSGTLFDTKNVCPECRFGENRKIGPLHINEKAFGKRTISSNLATQFVITERVKNLFEENEITGAIYEEVVGGKKGVPLNDPKRYLLLSSSILPEVTSRTIINTHRLCQRCNQGNLYYASMLTYNRKEMEEVKDFNFTKEYFGEAHIALQSVVISRKLYKLLITERKIERNVLFSPVKLY